MPGSLNMALKLKVKKRSRLVFLIVVILLGLVVFAVAYPMVSTGGDLAAY